MSISTPFVRTNYGTRVNGFVCIRLTVLRRFLRDDTDTTSFGHVPLVLYEPQRGWIGS